MQIRLTVNRHRYPAELEEKEWAAIAENNSLCYGLRVVRRKENGVTVIAGIERARYPGKFSHPMISVMKWCSKDKLAFRLKQRDIVSDRLASSTARDVVVSTEYHSIESSMVAANMIWQLYLRIPDYIIDDQSYVSIYETQSSLQSSLASSSFSEFDVSASG